MPHFTHTEGQLDSSMTLRDWFAGQALVGISVSADIPPRNAAQSAYELADFMLAERKNGPNK